MGKSLQRALLFGGQLKIVGRTILDPSLLLMCRPPISKDLIQLSDFASDLKVLHLCHIDVVNKVPHYCCLKSVSSVSDGRY